MANTKVKAEQLEAAQTNITSLGTLTALQVDNLNLNGNTISSTDTNGNIIITANGTGNVNVNTDVLAIQGTEGETASLALQADESDDAGDEWRFTTNTNQTLSIKNNISGSEVDHMTLTPHATVASSTVYVPGKTLIGHTTSVSSGWGILPALQIEGLASNDSSLSITRNNNGAYGGYLILAKSRGTNKASNTILQDNDRVGHIIFAGADGTDRYPLSAMIRSEVDGTPGENDMPGSLIFSTTQDGNQDPTDALTISATQNVGIGVTPHASSKLHVYGDTWLDSAGATNRSLYFRNQSTDTTGGAVKSDQKLSLWSGNGSGSPVQRVTIDTSGQVGIGVISPQDALHVNGNIRLETEGNKILFETSSTGAFAEIKAGDTFGSNRLLLQGDNGIHNIIDSNDNGTGDWSVYNDNLSTHQLFVKGSDGKVGIGDASPDSTLHVKDVNQAVNTWTSLTDAVTDASFRFFGSNHANEYGIFMGYANSSNDAQGIQASRTSGSAAFPLLLNPFGGNVGIGQVTPESRLHIENASSGTSVAADGSDILIVENNSSTLVDIRSPAANAGGILFSDPDARGRGAIYYYHNDGLDSMYFNTGGGSGRMIIDSAGKVGIGTTPDVLLHVQKNGEPDAAGLLILEANSGGRQIRFSPPSDSANGYIDYRGGNLLFKDDGSEVARFQGNTCFMVSNKIGIGTDAPEGELHIKHGSTNTFTPGNDSWHTVVIENDAGAATNTTGIAFLVSDDGYHGNAGTGIAAVKNGTNSDYGADLVFITRPQSAAAVERMRIKSDGDVEIKGAAGTSPVLQLINSDSEDTDTGREFTLRFSGFRSGGEATNNAQISGHSSGGSDNQKGELRLWASEADGTMDEKVRIGSSGNSDVAIYHSTNAWAGGLNMVSQNGTSFQIHHENSAGYGLMFNGEIYVQNECSAASFEDRTPYPISLDVAKAVIQSHEKLPEGQYEENNIDNQLDHSKLHAYVSRSKTRKEKLDDGTEGEDIIDKSRDMSATVSCLVEVTKDLMSKLEAAEARIQTLESS